MVEWLYYREYVTGSIPVGAIGRNPTHSSEVASMQKNVVVITGIGKGFRLDDFKSSFSGYPFPQGEGPVGRGSNLENCRVLKPRRFDSCSLRFGVVDKLVKSQPFQG